MKIVRDLGSHNDTPKGSSLLICYALQIGKQLPMFRSIKMLSSSRSISCTAVVVTVYQSTRGNTTEDSNLQRETGYSRKLSAHHPYLDVSQSGKILRIMFIDVSECKKPGLKMERGRCLAPKPELILHDYVVCFLYKHP